MERRENDVCMSFHPLHVHKRKKGRGKKDEEGAVEGETD